MSTGAGSSGILAAEGAGAFTAVATGQNSSGTLSAQRAGSGMGMSTGSDPSGMLMAAGGWLGARKGNSGAGGCSFRFRSVHTSRNIATKGSSEISGYVAVPIRRMATVKRRRASERRRSHTLKAELRW